MPVPASAAVETSVIPPTKAPNTTPCKNRVFISNSQVSASATLAALATYTTELESRFSPLPIEREG
jgi:hypothetical protein